MKTKRSSKPNRKNVWFVERHWSYIPVSTLGWLTYIPFVIFLLGSLYAVAQYTDSRLGMLFDVFPYWVSAVVVMHWIAGYKS